MTTKISIVLPVFNREQFLAEAIESVLSQTHENFELLISDNCSTDSSFSIATKYANTDSRIKLFKNETNIGAGINYNKLITEATGEFIELFGSDDTLEPKCLEVLLASFDANPSAVIATSGRRVINADGEVLSVVCHYPDSQLINGNVAKENLLKTLKNWIGSPVLWRSEYKYSGFDLRFFLFADLEYWCRVLNNGDIFYSNEILMNYRVQENSLTTQSLKNLNFAIDIIRLHDRYQNIVRPEGMNSEAFQNVILERLIEWIDIIANQRKCTFNQILLEPSNFEKLDPKGVSDANLEADCHDYQRIASFFMLQIAQNIEPSGFRQQVREFEARIEHLENELNEIRSSSSWKITAPLRELRAKLNR